MEILSNEMEVCVSCHEITDCPLDTPIDLRKTYIEGAGHLCEDCYENIYNLKKV